MTLKNILFLLAVAVFFTSCVNSKKSTSSIPKEEKVVATPPEGVTFTTIKNYKQFASIQMPYEGKGFGKQESGQFNDSGEEVPSILHYGSHITPYGDLSKTTHLKTEGGTNDIDVVLEGLKKSAPFHIKRYLTKENVIEEYSDVKIGDKICKRVLVSYIFTREDYSSQYYILGYIVPHNGTTAYFAKEGSKTSPKSFESEINLLDETIKYMIETVEFKE